jgi:hypothetical protein
MAWVYRGAVYCLRSTASAMCAHEDLRYRIAIRPFEVVNSEVEFEPLL